MRHALKTCTSNRLLLGSQLTPWPILCDTHALQQGCCGQRSACSRISYLSCPYWLSEQRPAGWGESLGI